MKLNGDIIFRTLEKALRVTITGEPAASLSLSRPEFYLDRSSSFLDDHVYVCSADHLPPGPRIGRNVLLVCLGDSPELDAFRRSCSIIGVPAEENIFEVFNLVQSVFNKFDAWEERINEILRGSASLQEMLDESRDVFENPMLLIGSDFNYLANTESDYLTGKLGLKLDGPSFDADAMAAFLTMHDLATDIKEPLLLNLMDRTTLSVNIFDVDEYLGCITVFGEFRDIRPSDAELCVHFAKMLRQAIQRNPALAGERATLRQAVRDIVMGRPADPEHSRIISLNNNRHKYFCVLFRPVNDTHQMPRGYVTSLVENRFPDSMAFEIGGHAAALIPVEEPYGERSFTGGLEPFAADLKLQCGVSQVFLNLFDVRHAFAQASSAMRIGLASGTSGPVFLFEDHILDQLLSNAVGETPVRFFYPEGLKRLKRHDMASQVSYVDTLKAYLNNNMSIARTSEELILHRSSLIDRLDRITGVLGCDLTDPDVRLLLQTVLRSEDLRT